MKKVIGFSLYGTDWTSKYTVGAFCNIEIAKKIFPDWICKFYISNQIKQSVIDEIKSHSNVEVEIFNDDGNPGYNKTRRFLPIDDPDVSVLLSRDTDSRLSKREKFLVDIFLESDKLFHSINDHRLHCHIMGGMWGMKKGALPNTIKSYIENSTCVRGNEDGDQVLMFSIIGPLLKDVTLHHKTEARGPDKTIDIPFDSVDKDLPHITHFIGEIFSSNNLDMPRDKVFF